MRPSIRLSASVVAIAASTWVLGLTNVGTSAAYASTWNESSYASRLAQLVNHARSQHGVAPLTVTSGTSQVAASWTSHLVAQQALSHNPNLFADVSRHGSATATFVAENVGQGMSNDPDGLFTAYMNSPEHRDNILDGRTKYLGIAVDFSSTKSWNTMDFVNEYGSSVTTAQASRPVSVTTRHSRVTQPSRTPALVKKPVAAPRPPAKPVQAKVQPRRIVAADPTVTFVSSSVDVASTVQPARHLPVAPAAVAGLLILGLVVGQLRTRKLTFAR